MQIWAHRGASAYAPENTMEAFRLAVEMGADGIELDVQMSADGELVVIHDEKVNRTSDGNGLVAEKTLAQLQALDLGIPGFEDARLPALADVYAYMQHRQIRLNVEIKCDDLRYWKLMWDKLCLLGEHYDLQANILYSSFYHPLLENIRAVSPNAPIALLSRKAKPELLSYAKHLNAQALHLSHKPLLRRPEVARACLDAGLQLNVWTVDDSNAVRRLEALGVHAVITNKPDVLKAP